jgi:hypothetical protein
LIIIIPILLIGFIAYSNFIVSQDFNTNLDIGSTQDKNKPYLTPLDRVGDIQNDSGMDYRNLTAGLVYFTANIPRGSDNVTIDFSFMNNFPNNTKLMIGARQAEDWNYTYNEVFNSSNLNFRNKGELINVSTAFNLKDLYISDGKLSLLFNVPHLGKNETKQYEIPIDWINITVHKDGIF